MISLKDAETIHAILIERHGGSPGIRDIGLLESAISRPYATFDNQELYTLPAGKAAAILESILINHPFVDWNKRTGYVLMRLILLESNLDIEATQDEKYSMVIATSQGEMRFDDIKTWIESRLRKK